MLHYNLKQVCCKKVVEIRYPPRLSHSHLIKANQVKKKRKLKKSWGQLFLQFFLQPFEVIKL